MRRTRTRLKRTVALAAVAMLALAGCGGAGKDDTVTLQMVESLTSPARTLLLRTLLDDFEAANSGVRVELVSPPTEQADGKLLQMLQSGTGVDVLEVRDITVGAYATNGWLYDMSEDLADWKGLDALSENAKALLAMRGDIDFMPYGFYGLSIFYRTDLVAQAGFDGPPDTWAELAEQATAIQDPSANTYGFALRGGKNGYQHAIQVIASYLADQIDPSNAYYLKDGSTIFGAPEALDALALYLSIFQNAAPPSSIAWGFPEMVEGFSNGSTAFLMQDPEVISAVQDSAAINADQWSTTPVLKGSGGKAFQTLAYAGWGVAANSSHTAEAVKLVQFLTSGEPSLEFSQSNNQIPILASAVDEEYYRTGPWESYFTMNADPETYVVGIQPREAAWWNEWAERADADLQRFLLGETSPAETLAGWDAYWAEKAQS